MNRRTSAAAGLAALVLLTACSASSTTPVAPSTTLSLAVDRLAAVEAAVTAWAKAATLAEARAGAEAARNLVTGPHVFGYGDLDGDGSTAGASPSGLLPGEAGQPGLVGSPAPDCVERDVLGGSWADPAGRWADVRTRIDRWTNSNNTFPKLRSHPQRVVGWASLALASTNLEEALEYSRHARLHVGISQQAVSGC